MDDLNLKTWGKVLGLTILFGIPILIMLFAWIEVHGIFLYFILSIIVAGCVMVSKFDSNRRIDIMVVVSLVIVGYPWLEYATKDDAPWNVFDMVKSKSQPIELSCDWVTNQQQVNLYAKPDIKSDVIGAISASGECVQEIEQTKYFVKAIAKDSKGETQTGYIRKLQLTEKRRSR